MPVAAVIFDLDGVIVDSEIWWHEERVAWAAERGLRWTEADTHEVMGANSSRWARIMRERLDLEERDEPAILEAVVQRVIDAALGATGLWDEIPVVVSSDEVAHGKPEPDVYLEAARRLRVPPGECLVVEDSVNGVRAGVAAGMTVILVPNASVPPAPGANAIAHYVLGNLRDLDPATIRLRAQ